tara:strand:+ start:269 stop:415 length:147 start_codon:yes stop_codon:yes gene_type:complete
VSAAVVLVDLIHNTAAAVDQHQDIKLAAELVQEQLADMQVLVELVVLV